MHRAVNELLYTRPRRAPLIPDVVIDSAHLNPVVGALFHRLSPSSSGKRSADAPCRTRERYAA